MPLDGLLSGPETVPWRKPIGTTSLSSSLSSGAEGAGAGGQWLGKMSKTEAVPGWQTDEFISARASWAAPLGCWRPAPHTESRRCTGLKGHLFA